MKSEGEKNIRQKDFKRGNRKVIYLVFGTRGSEKRGKKRALPYLISPQIERFKQRKSCQTIIHNYFLKLI